MKIKDLFQFKKEHFIDSERVLKRVINQGKRKAWLWSGIFGAAVVLSAVLVLIFGGFFEAPQQEIEISGAMNIIKSVGSEDGELYFLPLDASLKIKTDEDVSARELSGRIEIEPACEFKIKRVGECNYRLSISNLEENKLYNLKAMYNGLCVDRWAFQTVAPFRVVEASPIQSGSDRNGAIEVTFSHSKVEGFEKAFSIYPKVEGSFEQYGNTCAFIPKSPLEAGEIYTVEIKKSVFGLNGASLSEDYSFSFQTSYGEKYVYMIHDESSAIDSFGVSETPVAAVAWDGGDLSNASVKVFSFADADAFVRACKKYIRCGFVSSQIMDQAGSAVAQFEARPLLAEDYGSFEKAAFIQYPEPLAEGYYFAQIEIGGKKLYQLLQSSKLSVYALAAEDDYLIWVNDMMTGQPVKDETVDLEGASSTKTSASGLAILKNVKVQESLRYLKVGNAAAPFVALLQSGKNDLQKDDYIFYLTSDAPLYRKGETVRLFGAVMPRLSNGKIPSSVVLKSEAFEEELTLSPDANGAFNAEFIMPQSESEPLVSLWVGERCLYEMPIHLMNKIPPYYLSVSVDEKAYVIGQTMHFSGCVTDSNGAPVEGIEITNGNGINVFSDVNGNFSGTYRVEFDENADFEPLSVGRLHLYLEKNPEIFGKCSYLILPADYILEAERYGNTIKIAAFSTDLSGADAWNADVFGLKDFDKNLLKGDSAELNIIAELHEISYLKTAAGENYYSIGHQILPRWDYIEQDQALNRYEVFSSNGVATLDLPSLDSNKKYYVNLYLADNLDQTVCRIDLNESKIQNEYSNGSTYELVASDNWCSVGEKVHFRVVREDNHEQVQGGSVIYAVVSDEILDVAYGVSPVFDIEFKEEYKSDVWVYAAFFDGKHCYSLGREYLGYQKKDSNLRIEMEPITFDFAPGDEITLQFKVSDDTGAPIAASLNVSLMDRRLYLVNEYADPLSFLYSSFSKGSDIAYYSSYRDFNRFSDLGEGASWDEIPSPIGCNYESDSFSEMIHADKDGKASLTFNLPDGGVQWEVVLRGVAKGGMAGDNYFLLNPQKSLQTMVILPEIFDIEESCNLSVMADGEGLTAENPCQFKIGINDSQGKQISMLERQGIPGHYIHLDLGKLPADTYTVYIQSKTEFLEDNAIFRFDVKDQKEPILAIQSDSGEEMEFSLDSALGASVLTVMDKNMQLWSDALLYLDGVEGERVDQKLVQALLSDFYKSGNWNAASMKLSESYQEDGAKWKPSDDNGDLKLSAMLAALAPDSFDREGMKLFFDQYLNNRYASSSDRIIAYWGLGSLGEPILADLKHQYQAIDKLSQDEAIFMALAFAYCGDHETARIIYQQQIQNYFSEAEGYCYKSGERADPRMTALSAILAARIGAEEADDLLRYCLSNASKCEYLNFSLIAYLNHYVGKSNESVRISVAAGDRLESYSLDRYAPLHLMIEKEDSVRITCDDPDIAAVCGHFISAPRN